MDFEQYREQFFYYYKAFYELSDSYKKLCGALNKIDLKENISSNGLIEFLNISDPLTEGFRLLGATPLGRICEHRGKSIHHLPPCIVNVTIPIDITLDMNSIKKHLQKYTDEILGEIKRTKMNFDRMSPTDNDSVIVLFDFIRDAKGNIDYFSLKNDKPFSLWERALTVYKLKDQDTSWICIAKKLGIWGQTVNCENTARTTVKRSHDLAKRLIKSAEASTFPL